MPVINYNLDTMNLIRQNNLHAREAIAEMDGESQYLRRLATTTSPGTELYEETYGTEAE